MPVTETLTWSWHETPNIHFCSIRDFLDLAHEIGATIERGVVLDRRGRVMKDGSAARWNLFGETAVFLVRR